MRFLFFAAVAGAVVAAPASADHHQRELDAHEHGHGSLNIAVEGKTVLMELEAPGADIVGFEHSAESAEDRARVEAAKAVLAQPLDIFILPAEAACSVEQTTVSVIGDSDDEHHEAAEHEDAHHSEHDDDHHGEDEEAHHEEHEEEGSHNEFHAAYTLRCADPSAISSIGFSYFETFSGAQELEVNLISDRGQAAFEVERDDPRIDVAGLI